MKSLIYIGIASLFFVSCGKHVSKEVISKSNPNSHEVVEVQSNPKERIAQQKAHHYSRTIFTDLIHTKLEVSVDWNKSQLSGLATLTLKPHWYPTDSVVLDAKGMDILSITQQGKQVQFKYDSTQLFIHLDKQYQRTEEFQLQVKYVAKPEDRKIQGGRAITSDKGLYFINPTGKDKQVMPQIWTQGETESNSVWFPTIDSPNMKSTEELYITVANKYVTLSNGKLISSKQNSDGTRTDYWKQDLPHAPYLFMLAIGEFKIIKDAATLPSGKKIAVDYYVEPEWEQSAKAIFGETPEMIQFFSKLLGIEFPWDKYAQIVVRDYVSGAMENTSAVIFGDFVYKTPRELLDDNDRNIIAHELFHHWFGDLVTCESWSNLTLNESFANYSEYLWDEYRYGKDHADYNAELEAEGYYKSGQSSGYHPLVWFDYTEKDQMFDQHSYNKGGRILHQLRVYLGDEAFFKGISNYLKNNQFKSAEFHQLRIAFEEVCGEDLTWFFNQWYEGKAHPVLNIRQQIDSKNKTVKVIIDQVQNTDLAPIFRLPLSIAVYDEQGKKTHKVVVNQLSNSFTFSYSGNLACVLVDEEQATLAKIREEKSQQQYAFQLTHGTRYRARKDALNLGVIGSDSLSQSLVLAGLNDSFWHIRSLAIDKISQLKEGNLALAIEQLKEMFLNDPSSMVRAKAFSALIKLEKGKNMETLVESAKVKEQSYHVLSTVLKEYAQINSSASLALAKTLESETSPKMLTGVAQVYQSYGTKNEFDFFIKALKGTFSGGYDQLAIMNSFSVYLCRMDDIAFFESALESYRDLAENGKPYTRLFLPNNMKYMSSFIQQKSEVLNQQIEAFEKNKDMVYANQTRELLRRYKTVQEAFKHLQEQ